MSALLEALRTHQWFKSECGFPLREFRSPADAAAFDRGYRMRIAGMARPAFYSPSWEGWGVADAELERAKA